VGAHVIDGDFDGLLILTDHWPVIILDFPGKLLPDAALRDGLSHVTRLLEGAGESGEKTYGIVDLTRLALMAPPSQRKIVGDWLSRTLLLQKVVNLGIAAVTPSAVFRGLVTAIYWLARPPVPSVFVATRSAAFAEAVKAFDAARVPLSGEVRDALRRAG
jgi:hypothetical protein